MCLCRTVSMRTRETSLSIHDEYTKLVIPRHRHWNMLLEIFSVVVTSHAMGGHVKRTDTLGRECRREMMPKVPPADFEVLRKYVALYGLEGCAGRSNAHFRFECSLRTICDATSPRLRHHMCAIERYCCRCTMISHSTSRY